MDKLIDFMIKNGANMNVKNNNGYTPLYYACIDMNKFYLIPKLIKAGADINVKNNEGESLIIRLLKRPQTIKVIGYFIEYRPYYEIEDYFLKETVRRSLKEDIEIPVKMLIDAGANVSRTPIADYSKTVADRLPDDVLGIIQTYIEDEPLKVAIEKGFDTIAELIANKREIDLIKYKTKYNLLKPQ